MGFSAADDFRMGTGSAAVNAYKSKNHERNSRSSMRKT